ncbi:hypothetical protein K492DRAFT_209987 [Lichtheimia hyalospora FSU 10163]|nr:hypothetical protein K492DRAFT_209987 [Lichtheimia hyalospora FSU 10163]
MNGNVQDNRRKDANTRTACFRCRGFRHACDRQRPSCSRCQGKGVNCVYPEAAPTMKKLQQLADDLARRVTSLENLVATSEPTAVAEHVKSQPLLMKHFALYPCQKCNHLQQPCDMRVPSCSRCTEHGITCAYLYDEKPKVYHISHAISTMNNVLDEYESTMHTLPSMIPSDNASPSSISTTDTNNTSDDTMMINTSTTTTTTSTTSTYRKPIWTIMSTPNGFSGVAHVSSYNELRLLLDHVHDTQPGNKFLHKNDIRTLQQQQQEQLAVEAGTTTATADMPFSIWKAWANPTQELPRDYPIDVTSQLTSDLLELYCRTPCCSMNRLPIVDGRDILARYHSPDPEQRPSKVLVYAICAITARNAFQVHVWSKRPAHETPHYNMGKALSIAYWLSARKLLAECFDEPSLDTCRAALFLSYCSHHNGYLNLVRYYDWITVSMAQELGLFDRKELPYYDGLLAWVIYYWHVWMRVLGAGSPQKAVPIPSSPPPSPPPLAESAKMNDEEYNIHNILRAWSFRFQLQLQRDEIMSSTLSAQKQQLDAEHLSHMFKPFEADLKAFFESLPDHWQYPPKQAPDNDQQKENGYTVGRDVLEHGCIVEVQVQYYINVIMLHHPFLLSSSSNDKPMSPFTRRSLDICLHAAQTITCALENFLQGCSVPLIGLVFSNSVYQRIYQCTRSPAALKAMQQSLVISKASLHYAYDFESHRPLVRLMEQKVQAVDSKEGDQDVYMGWLS